MSPQAKILACIDGSEYTEPSIDYAIWLSEGFDGIPIRFHYITDVGQFRVPLVNEMGTGVGLQPCNGLFRELYEQEQEHVQELRGRVENYIEKKGIGVSYDFFSDQGFPIDALKIENARYDHLVIGKRGEHEGKEHEKLGSNLHDFLNHADRPCLVSSRTFIEVNRFLLLVSDAEELTQMEQYWRRLARAKSVELVLAGIGPADFQKRVEAIGHQLGEDGFAASCLRVEARSPDVIDELLKSEGCDAVSVVWNLKSRFWGWFRKDEIGPIMNACRVPFWVLPRSSA